MKELKTITEYQLLRFAYCSLLERISYEEDINERTKEKLGRDNLTCHYRLKMYNEQLEEVRDRILEIEHNNLE